MNFLFKCVLLAKVPGENMNLELQVVTLEKCLGLGETVPIDEDADAGADADANSDAVVDADADADAGAGDAERLVSVVMDGGMTFPRDPTRDASLVYRPFWLVCQTAIVRSLLKNLALH